MRWGEKEREKGSPISRPLSIGILFPRGKDSFAALFMAIAQGQVVGASMAARPSRRACGVAA